MPSTDRVIVGSGQFRYEALPKWEQLPTGWSYGEVVAVATDRKDNVYVFNRGEHPVIIFDRNGKFIKSWGEGDFVRPHGIHIASDDTIWCIDDRDHAVRKFTLDGKHLLTLGTRGQASDTGVVNGDYRTIKRAGPPFNLPTDLAIGPTGDLFITDGYGNSRVHKFSADGKLLLSWGEPGNGPGQFNLPHGIAVDSKGTVYVADRENDRVPIFTSDGKFVTEWKLNRPAEVFVDPKDNIFVAEMGWRAGLFPGTNPRQNPPGGSICVLNREGKILARWGGGPDPCAVGDFFAPHDVWLDSKGAVYVSEVVMSAGGNRGLVSPTCHTLQKFVPV